MPHTGTVAFLWVCDLWIFNVVCELINVAINAISKWNMFGYLSIMLYISCILGLVLVHHLVEQIPPKLGIFLLGTFQNIFMFVMFMEHSYLIHWLISLTVICSNWNCCLDIIFNWSVTCGHWYNMWDSCGYWKYFWWECSAYHSNNGILKWSLLSSLRNIYLLYK